MMLIAKQGYGSTGSDRSKRRIRIHGGVGTTSREMDRRAQRGRPSIMGDLPPKVIEEAVKTQQCCWCNDDRTFKNIGSHWQRSHGFDLQELRDYLLWPKSRAFMSAEMREAQSQRMRNDTEWSKSFRSRGKEARERGIREGTFHPKLGAYGRKVHGSNLMRPDVRDHAMERGQEAAEAKRAAGLTVETKPQTCVICETIFFHTWWRATCASKDCISRLRSQQQLSMPEELKQARVDKFTTWRAEHPEEAAAAVRAGHQARTAQAIAAREDCVCVVCGKIWRPSKRDIRKTCSPKCHEERRRQIAHDVGVAAHAAKVPMYEKVVALRAEGLPQHEVAKRVGLSQTRVALILKEQGIAPTVVRPVPKGPTMVEKSCIICHSTFSINIKNRARKTCSRECLLKRKSEIAYENLLGR